MEEQREGGVDAIESMSQFDVEAGFTVHSEILSAPSSHGETGDAVRPDDMIATATPIPTNIQKETKIVSRADHESFVFAARLATSMVISSLFVLLASPTKPWPQGIWVYISTGVVAWQTSLDTASVTKKTLERIAGTILGAAMGFAAGFTSLLVSDNRRTHAFVIGIMMALESFIYPYFVSRTGYRSSYAALLANFTFGVVILGFYSSGQEDKPWKEGVYRIVNIIIGCLIAGFTAYTIMPFGVERLIREKIKAQMRNAGLTAKALLHQAAKYDINEPSMPTLTDLVGKSEVIEDEAHSLYIKSMEQWRDCRQLFPMLKYDPVAWKTPKAEMDTFVQHMKLRLARTFRIQVTLVMIDSVVRAGFYRSNGSDPLDMLLTVGDRVQVVLDRALPRDQRVNATEELLSKDLVRLRRFLTTATKTHQAEANEETSARVLQRMLSAFEGLPSAELVSPGQSVLLYRLMEQLIIRVVRLHHFCEIYEDS